MFDDLGEAPTANEILARQQAAEQKLRQAAAAQMRVLGGGIASMPANLSAMLNETRAYPPEPAFPFGLRFREVEGGYLAAFACGEGGRYKEVLCPTAEDVAKLVLRMIAEKAMQ